jgi:hypothetical protein
MDAVAPLVLVTKEAEHLCTCSLVDLCAGVCEMVLALVGLVLFRGMVSRHVDATG